MINTILEGWEIFHNHKLSLDELHALRNRKLKALINHAYQNVSFYRSLFDSINLSPEDINTVDDLKKIPITRKDDFRRAGVEKVLVKGVDKSLYHSYSTSGSLGKPFTTYFSTYEYWIRRLLGFRRLRNAGQRWQDKVCVVCDAGLFSTRRYRTNCVHILDSPKEQVEALKRIQPTVLKIWPTNLRILLQHTNDLLAEFVRPKVIAFSGEICEDSFRDHVQACMGTEVFNFYGAGEFGPIASECQAHQGLHIDDDQLIVECFKDGEPARSGEMGEIVITSLYGFTMPFIRYSLGDVFSKLDKPCSCGSSFGLIQRLIGKKDDAIVLTDGRILFGTPSTLLRRFKEIYHYRLIQETISDFVLKLVFLKAPENQTLYQIHQDFINCFGQQVKLDLQVVDSIEEEPGRKFRKVISKVSWPGK